MSHKTIGSQPSNHISEDPRKQQDHVISVIVAVPVVELLEVVQIGVTDGEGLSCPEPFSDVSLDLHGSWKASRGMHGHIALSTPNDELEAELLFAHGVGCGDDFVDSRGEPIGDQIDLVG